MANNKDTASLIRQAKYEVFIRHTSVPHDEATTAKKFSRYVEQDNKREKKFMDLRSSILEGLKA